MDGLTLYSPFNQQPLTERADGLLDDGERLWPVVDGIPWLRPKEDLRQKVVDVLRRGDRSTALKLLLADQDDFSPTAPPDPEALTKLLDRTGLNLREAMAALNYGPVGEYFAYRWCSPTFRSGLYLLECSVPRGGTVIEVACGIGHFLRELEVSEVSSVGLDLVFSKLWLARHYLGVTGPLVCGDVSYGPLSLNGAEVTVFCHDAFYFFPDKVEALRRMRTLAGPNGRLAVGHVHTFAENHAAGHRLDTNSYACMAAGPIYDDASVATAWYAGYDPLPPTEASPAVSWLEGKPVKSKIQFRPTADCRRSPVLNDQRSPLPSEDWWTEFAGDAADIPVSIPGRTHTNGGSFMAAEAQEKTLDRQEAYRQGYLINLPATW
ncbi:MAG: class I SAM-dependent methyltransferase [Lewinella sp.]